MLVTLELTPEQVVAIRRQLDGDTGGALVPITPAGMVAVRPTGARGAGKVRYWPDPTTLPNPHANLLGYASQVAERLNPATSMEYVNRNTLGRYFQLPTAVAELAAHGPGRYPECADRMEYPEDWLSFAELARYEQEVARDRAQGRGFSPA
jgi:hypothetical protein